MKVSEKVREDQFVPDATPDKEVKFIVVSCKERCYDFTCLPPIYVRCADRGPGAEVLSNFVNAKPLVDIVSALLISPVGL